MRCFILCAADDGRRIAYFATRRWVRRTLAALLDLWKAGRNNAIKAPRERRFG